MHDDSDVIQASTADTIRRPRLWANSKEMKTDTYSDRCSTTCRNDSTMSSKWTGNRNSHRLQHDGNSCLKSGVGGRQQNEVSHRGTTSHSHAYVHHTNLLQSGDQSGDSTRKWRDSYSKTCLRPLRQKANTTYKIIYDVACLHEGIIAGVYDAIGTLIPDTEAFFKSNEKIRWCGDITTRFTPASDGEYYIAVTARGANHPKSGVPNSNWNTFTGIPGTLSITVTSPLSTAATDESLRGVSQRVTSTPTRGAGDTYGVGDAITFELTFSEPVSVSGAPKLRFNIGGTRFFPEHATYVSVSGATLTFSYTVLTADIDPDGIYLFDDPLAYNLQNDDSIVSVRLIRDEFGHGRPLTAVNFFSGWDRTFPGHKVDGSLTN